jgi:hypothetical protein
LHEALTSQPYGSLLRDSITEFLGIAKSIQEFGLNHFQDNWKGPRETLLDPDNIWRVPDSVQRLRPRWAAKPLGWLLTAMETYKAS